MLDEIGIPAYSCGGFVDRQRGVWKITTTTDTDWWWRRNKKRERERRVYSVFGRTKMVWFRCLLYENLSNSVVWKIKFMTQIKTGRAAVENIFAHREWFIFYFFLFAWKFIVSCIKFICVFFNYCRKHSQRSTRKTIARWLQLLQTLLRFWEPRSTVQTQTILCVVLLLLKKTAYVIHLHCYDSIGDVYWRAGHYCGSRHGLESTKETRRDRWRSVVGWNEPWYFCICTIFPCNRAYWMFLLMLLHNKNAVPKNCFCSGSFHATLNFTRENCDSTIRKKEKLTTTTTAAAIDIMVIILFMQMLMLRPRSDVWRTNKPLLPRHR